MCLENNGLCFLDAGSSESEPIKAILLIMIDLMMAMFFAYSALLSCKLLKINKLLVEAAGVEPASEIAVSQENPCSVRFRMFSPHTLRTDKMRIKLVR
jgi:hypothetical protein